MKRKKRNPNHEPVSVQQFDSSQIVSIASDGKVLQAWAVILTGLAGFQETTQQDMIKLWDAANSSYSMIQGFEGAEKMVKQLSHILRKDIPFYRIHPSNVHTRGDLARFTRRAEHNAVYASLAVIMEPMFREHLLDRETLNTILRKAVLMNEEIAEGEITVWDLQRTLLDEYGLLLEKDGRNAQLSVAVGMTDV